MLADLFLEDLIEAVAFEHRKLSELDPLERRFEKITADRFELQEAAFWRWAGTSKPAVDISEAATAAAFPEPSASQWNSILGTAGNNYDKQAFELAHASWASGATGAMDSMQLANAFALPNPKAVAYLNNYSARLVAGIDDTTRITMTNMLRNARAAGLSYEQTAKRISASWSSMSVPRPQQHIRSRAHMIAVTETAAAYEQGNRFTYSKIEAAGIPLEMSWLVAGDSRVCPICDGHAAKGWSPSSEWADITPPGHPACRCTLLARMDKSKAKPGAIDKLIGPKPAPTTAPAKVAKFKTPTPSQATVSKIESMSNLGLKPGPISKALTAVGEPVSTAQVRYYLKKIAADKAKKAAPQAVSQQAATALRTASRSVRRGTAPKEFVGTNLDEVHTIMRKYRPLEKAHTAFASYTRLSYQKINNFVRGRAGIWSNPSAAIKRSIARLDAGMVELKEAIVVYRGSSLSGVARSLGKLDPYEALSDSEMLDLVGKTLLDKAYTSTSVIEERAFGGQVRFKLTAPEGTKGAWLGPSDTGFGPRMPTISGHPSEYEFLLQRHSSIRVTKVYKGKTAYGSDQWTVEGVIQQPLDLPALP